MISKLVAYARATARNRLLPTAITILGLWGSALGIVSAAFGSLPPAVWLGLIVLSFVASAAISRPRWRRLYRFASGAWQIEIMRGDLFDQGASIVVTTDRAMSTSLSLVGSESLVGQLVERWYSGDQDQLRASLDRPASRLLPPGSVARFRASDSRTGWLVSLARDTVRGPTTSWQDLALAHDALWDALRAENARTIAVPVIGAGFARARLPYRALVVLLVISFHAACLEGRVASSLRVVMPPEEFDPRVLRTIDDLLGALDYTVA